MILDIDVWTILLFMEPLQDFSAPLFCDGQLFNAMIPTLSMQLDTTERSSLRSERLALQTDDMVMILLSMLLMRSIAVATIPLSLLKDDGLLAIH